MIIHFYTPKLYHAMARGKTWSAECLPSNSVDLNEFFTQKGEELLQISDRLDKNPVNFKLTDQQWQRIDDFFTEQLQLFGTSHGVDTSASVKRMGVIVVRIGMILSVLREEQRSENVTDLYCSDQDFSTALALGNIYLQHASVMLQMIPGSDAQAMVNRRDRLYHALPSSFTRAEGVPIGLKENISERSTDRYLEYFIKKGMLIQPKYGEYQKT